MTVKIDDTNDDPLGMFWIQSVPVRIGFGAMSHAGKVRSNNEDNYVVVQRSRTRSVLKTSLSKTSLPYSQDDAFMMIVADGMGGQAFGEVASSMALRAAWNFASEASSWIMKLDKDNLQEVKDRAVSCMQVLNRALLERAKSNPEFEGMGTTLTCAYSMGADLVVIHVGDSRAYIVDKDGVRQLTRDHTLAQGLIDAGMSPDDTIAFRHLLTNCLGADTGEVVVDVTIHQLKDGDRLLLCTDGLTDLVRNEEIGEVLAQNRDADAACQALVDLALERGGKDNVTVVLANYEIPSDRDTVEF